MNKKELKEERDLAKKMTEIAVKTFFKTGSLTKKDLDLSKDDFFKKVIEILDKTEFVFVTDHRDEILNQADNFLKAKKYDYAKLFYATFFEHSLNSLISFECQKRKIDTKTQTDIIRSIDIHGKLTWLLRIFGHKKFSEKHLKTIKQLSEDRNSFVHYKWKEIPDDYDHNNEESKMLEVFKKIKSAVKYMKTYQSTIEYSGNKKKLVGKVKKRR